MLISNESHRNFYFRPYLTVARAAHFEHFLALTMQVNNQIN